MPGVQILFHSSGERVGGPNLPQRGFFVPAVRGAAVRCGDFSAGKGRSGRFRGRGRLRAGKRLNRRGVPVCGGESSRRAGKGWKMGDGSGGWKQKNPEGACRSPDFFMIRNLRINRAAPVVLPPFCRRSAAVRAAELRSSPPRLLVVLPPPPPLSFCPAFLAPRYL